MKYLLDTCVLSEFVKATPEAKVLAWINARDENDLHVAAMSLAELRRGVALSLIHISEPTRPY